MTAVNDDGGVLLQPICLRLTSDIVAAYVGRNAVAVSAVPDMLAQIYHALRGLDEPQAPAPAQQQRLRPAVPIARSVQHEHIVCLEDGKKLKMLKRYLRARYDLSPEECRRCLNGACHPTIRWSLPPMQNGRSAFAKEIGLGRGVRRGRTG